MVDYLNKIICGDAIKELRRIDADSVALAVTSPPYWNLVDYGVPDQYGQCSYDDYLKQSCESRRYND